MDLISRQAAIEALKRAEALTKAFGYHNVIETIRELPTAEPMTGLYVDGFNDGYKAGKEDAEPEIIRCKDCKHFHENVWGNEIGLDDLPIIVGHEACDAWGREWTQSCADGYCHMAERRTDG